MANKRQTKKAIREACGHIASECIVAESALRNTDNLEQWDNIIIDTALLQQKALQRVRFAMEQKPRQFADRRAYNRARKQHTKAQEQQLSTWFRSQVEDIATRMNGLLPHKG